MDDWKLELTSQQADTLEKFRDNVSDTLKPQHDDFFLVRFLRARNFDLKKAEQMIRKSLKWREDNNIDELLSWDPPEVMQKYWPGGVFGVDNEGHPILWQLCKGFDPQGMMKCVKKEDIVKFHMYRMEKVMQMCNEQSKKLGRRIHNAMHISDLDGFGLSMVFTPGIKEAMKEVFALYEANYPENLYSSYVINAPAAFPVIFNILKPFLSESTKRKVHILGKSWSKEIFKAVEPDQIPEHWGGTARDPDPHCTDHITQANTVPTTYYLWENLQVDKAKLKTITVLRGSEYILFFDITQPGTVISWVFKSDDYDLGFGIYYAETRTKATMKDYDDKICPMKRINCQQIPETGNYNCQKTGTYVVSFDNTYSWVTNKTVYFNIEVNEPVTDSLFEGKLQNGSVYKRPGDGIDTVLESTHL